MSEAQREALEKLRESIKNVSQMNREYWEKFSSFDTWQFWVCLTMLLIPLFIILWRIDRKRIFQVGFFGYGVHVWTNYIDNLGVLNGWWEYPYKAFPFLPVSFILDASIIPVAYMLVYQWCLNEHRNRYLYLILLSAAFAFVIKPIMTLLHLFKYYEWVNYGYIFIAYLLLCFLSLWTTDLFSYLQRKAKSE